MKYNSEQLIRMFKLNKLFDIELPDELVILDNNIKGYFKDLDLYKSGFSFLKEFEFYSHKKIAKQNWKLSFSHIHNTDSDLHIIDFNRLFLNVDLRKEHIPFISFYLESILELSNVIDRQNYETSYYTFYGNKLEGLYGPMDKIRKHYGNVSENIFELLEKGYDVTYSGEEIQEYSYNTGYDRIFESLYKVN